MQLQWRPKTEAAPNGTNVETNFSDILFELRAELKILQDEESHIRGEINKTIIDAEKRLGENDFLRIFDQSMARLNVELDTSKAEVRQLASSLKAINGLADNISGRVLALDVARSRVVQCLQRVSDLRDLRTCAEGVQEAMAQQEYDEAARHIYRFLSLDSAVFKAGEQPDAAEDADQSQSMRQCYDTLRVAAVNLKAIVEQKFDKARAANDSASMERFFKIFPMINEHASGLIRFADHLTAKIAAMGEENFRILQAGGTDDSRKNVIYADALRLFFERLARLIELHQPLIDNFYGADKLLTLLEFIQPECDKQSLRVVNAFMQKRHIDLKAKKVDVYLRNGTLSAEEKIDALELDVLLTETTLMHTHAELYWRFLKRRVGEAEAPSTTINESADSHQPSSVAVKRSVSSASNGGGKSPPLSPTLKELPEVDFFEAGSTDGALDGGGKAHRRAEELQQLRAERNHKLDVLLHRTALNLKMQDILGKYVLMEQYYMIETVRKAIEMDDVEEGSLTSTLLDDVFFIVRKSIRRSISSSAIDCVCAVLNNGVTLLETEFVKYVNAPIRAGYPSVGWTSEAYQTAAQTAQSAYQQVIQPTAAKFVGAAATGDKDSTTSGNTTERQRSAFITALNNLRASITCVGELRAGLVQDFQRQLAQISELEKSKLENSVGQLDDLSKKLEYYVGLGLTKLCEAAFRSKFKSCAEEYLNVSHTLTDDDLMEYEAADPFMGAFIAQLDRHIAGFETALLQENYQALLLELAVEAFHQFERCIFKCDFNRLGALQLDKEFRQLTAYFTSEAGWAVHERCAHLSQVVALLNSDTFDEAVEFLQQKRATAGGDSADAPLALGDIRKILALRVDFPYDRIKHLRL